MLDDTIHNILSLGTLGLTLSVIGARAQANRTRLRLMPQFVESVCERFQNYSHSFIGICDPFFYFFILFILFYFFVCFKLANTGFLNHKEEL